MANNTIITLQQYILLKTDCFQQTKQRYIPEDRTLHCTTSVILFLLLLLISVLSLL
jgi:hypothetical protein